MAWGILLQAEALIAIPWANRLGVFRLWRDMGYAFGALLTGIIAELINLHAAIIFIATLTVISGLIIKFRMFCLPAPKVPAL